MLENLMKPFRRVDLRKECELSHVGDIKGPARLSGGLKQPIGCRQREHVVVKENGKARRGIHTNENRDLCWLVLTVSSAIQAH